MNSENGSSVDHYVNELHRCAAQGDVDGLLAALKSMETSYSLNQISS